MNADAGAGATRVFLSYAREDVELAQALAEALGADGHRVWWDRRLLGGSDFAAAIERELAAARLVLVLWSAASVQSGFVRDESTRAREAGKLLPVRIEDVPLPLGFGSLHTLDLIGWDGDADDDACKALRDEVRRLLAPGSALGLPDARQSAARTSLAWRRWRRPTAVAAAAVVIAATAWFVLAPDGNALAQTHLEKGLAAQFDTEPNLEVARNAYLAALRASSDFAPAHYYLAHVYAQLQLPADARTHFEAALAHERQLDPQQRQIARQQLQAVVALLANSDLPTAAAAATAAPAPTTGPTRPADSGPAPAPLPPPAAAPPAPTVRPGGVAAPNALVRTAPSEVQSQAAQTQATALLGRDRQAQVSAATTLALNTTLAADALPKVLASTIDALRSAPEAPATREAVARSLRLLQQASPSLLRTLGRDAQRVVDAGRNFGGTSGAAADDVHERLARAEALKPFVFVQIADERQRALAQGLVSRLAGMGYSAPGIENVGAARAPAHTEVRTQGPSDPALARWMAQHVARLVAAEVPVRALPRAEPKTDTYEIWFDKDLCVTPARMVDACQAR